MSKRNRQGIKAVHNPSGVKELSVVSETHDSLLPAIPSPDDMKKYEDMQPGFTDRVLTMAEKQQSHFTEMSKVVDERNFLLAKRAQNSATIISVLIVFASMYGFYAGFGYPAAILTGIGVSTPIIVGLILGKK